MSYQTTGSGCVRNVLRGDFLTTTPISRTGWIVGFVMLVGALVFGASAVEAGSTSVGSDEGKKTSASFEGPAEYVILFVLEGVGREALTAGPMPTLSRLVKEGSVTWAAENPTPSRRLPSMASIVTGLPVEKHGVTWDQLDFARGFPRVPTLFDYMDLGGGKDAAIFYMDESLYQLAKPEIYTDYQICGPLRPECNSDLIVRYIRDYLKKASSGGYNHWILSLPHLLVVHLPEAGRVGQSKGWNSEEFRKALNTVDHALGSILDMYRDSNMLATTTVFVTALNTGEPDANEKGKAVGEVPWIAWGLGIRAGHEIQQPVSLVDTGATVMRTLGLETYTEWESHSIEEVFTSSRMVNTASGEQRAHGR